MAMVKLLTAPSATEAHFVRAHLENAGIHATVLGESLQAGVGPITSEVSMLPSVYVEADDADRAAAAMRDFEESATRNDDSGMLTAWTCPACNEVVEGQFTSCWNCGTERGSPELSED